MSEGEKSRGASRSFAQFIVCREHNARAIKKYSAQLKHRAENGNFFFKLNLHSVWRIIARARTLQMIEKPMVYIFHVNGRNEKSAAIAVKMANDLAAINRATDPRNCYRWSPLARAGEQVTPSLFVPCTPVRFCSFLSYRLETKNVHCGSVRWSLMSDIRFRSGEQSLVLAGNTGTSLSRQRFRSSRASSLSKIELSLSQVVTRDKKKRIRKI